MNDQPSPEVLRLRLVRDNLAARLGALMAENIELLARIYELEQERSLEALSGEAPA